MRQVGQRCKLGKKKGPKEREAPWATGATLKRFWVICIRKEERRKKRHEHTVSQNRPRSTNDRKANSIMGLKACWLGGGWGSHKAGGKSNATEKGKACSPDESKRRRKKAGKNTREDKHNQKKTVQKTALKP